MYRTILWVQGSYTFITALWALLDIESFMYVTGPKTDTWLVKTVAILFLTIAICLLAAAIQNFFSWPIALLAVTNSAGVALLEFYYTGKDTISEIYRVDGIIQIIFLISWAIVIAKKLT